MNTKEYSYSWHLSLRVDRPVEGCSLRPHSYMYGKKLDEREADKPLPPHSKKMREPPPEHEFSYRWFRGPTHEPCAYEGCPRRTSFSPHDWSMHALGGAACGLQCVSTQSSLYKCTFCNSKCFVNAWKTQYTVPKEMRLNSNGNNRNATPLRQRSNSVESLGMDDDARSVGSAGSMGRMNGSKSPVDGYAGGGTPRGYLGSYNSASMNPGAMYGGYNSNGVEMSHDEGWIEICRDQYYIPGPEDIGRRLKLEAASYSAETGELLMHRVVKTDLVLSRAPDPVPRPFVSAKSGPAGGGARFRIASYNVLAEIYATQQQYPYCDIWALSWDYRYVIPYHKLLFSVYLLFLIAKLTLQSIDFKTLCEKLPMRHRMFSACRKCKQITMKTIYMLP